MSPSAIVYQLIRAGGAGCRGEISPPAAGRGRPCPLPPPRGSHGGCRPCFQSWGPGVNGVARGGRYTELPSARGERRERASWVREGGGVEPSGRKQTAQTMQVGCLGLHLPPPPKKKHTIQKGLALESDREKMQTVATMGKPENKSLPPRNDVEAPGYAAHVLFNSESTKESKKE